MRPKKYCQIIGNELLHSVRHLVSDQLLSTAAITAVFTKDAAGNWKYLIGKCDFCSTLNEVEEIYSDAAFVKKVVNGFNLDEFLSFLWGDGIPLYTSRPRVELMA
jgi:hypothetical protein